MIKRWSVAVEMDISFSATDVDDALTKAGEIAEAIRVKLEGRRPPGRRGGSARVYCIETGGDGGVLEMGADA